MVDPKPPEVSVVVPIRNEIASIRVTLADALAQDYEGGIEFLLVDGESDDGTTAILAEQAQRDPRCRLLANPEHRTPNALNVGLRAARGRYLVRMDAHTFYPRDYVRRGVERLERGGATWVTGPQLPRGRDAGSRRVALALETWLGVGGATFRRDVQTEVEVDTGFTGVMERRTLERLGGWDEGWPINQDAELAARVREDGGRIVCLPELAAGYVPRSNLRGLARQYGRYGRYRVKTAVRHPNSVRVTHLLPPGLALAALLALAAPTRRGRRTARAGLATYSAALLVTSGRHLRERPLDALFLPAVFATMHLSFGFGVLGGIGRYGVPAAGVAEALRRSSLSD